MAVNVQEIRKRLSTVLGDENLANEYLLRFGPKMDIKNIKKLKEEKKAETREEDGPGDDPIYEIKVKCPVCGMEGIVSYELRAKSQTTTYNKFMVPQYEGAMGYRTVDYARIAVTVCPRCLFASPDKKDFVSSSTTVKNIPSQIPQNTIMTLQERIGERKAFLKGVSDPAAFFKRPRSNNAAILSYRLALLRANVEAYYEAPFSYYKMGAYVLKIAHVMKDGGKNNEDSLLEAVSYLADSFRLSNSPSEEIEYQSLYTIVALYLKLGNDKKASSYLGVFDRIQNDLKGRMREDPSIKLNAIEKWSTRTKDLWEDRQNPDLFKDC